MRKLLAIALAFMFLFPTVCLAEKTADFQAYRSDFSKDADGWYARSAGNAVGAVENGVYVITGREASWNSPGRDFDLLPGKEYHINVEVMQQEEEKTSFMVSIAKTTAGVTSYENLVSATGEKGKWVALTVDYTAPACDQYTLYVETSGSGEVSFAIRDFSIALKNAHYDMSLPSLKEKWAEYFDFGTSVVLPEATNKQRMDFYASQFAIITAGNEMKPDSILDVSASRRAAREDDTAVAVHFTNALPMLNYCRDNGIKVHGHVLVWHSQTPEAFFHVGYDTSKPLVTREVMLARLDNYMAQVFAFLNENYPGLVVSWDVVNEAVADGSTELRESLWTQVVGQDFVNQAFKLARKYAAEDTLLFYNDYNTYYEPKLTGICKLVDSLIADGTIDGYGFQMHIDATTQTDAQLQNAIDTLASRSIKLRVSELDVGIPDTTEKQLHAQAKRYADLMEMIKPYAEQFMAVQVWGVSDHLSWRAENNPLLFDRNDQPKYAFWALTDPDKVPEQMEKAFVYGPGDESLLDQIEAVRGRDFKFKAVYTEDNALLVWVMAQDGTRNPEDEITVFVNDQVASVKKMVDDVTKVGGGYSYVFRFENVDLSSGVVGFDVMINNKGQLSSWNDPANATEGRRLGQLTVTNAE